MLKSIKWQEDGILSIQVKEGLFTLAQMRVNSLMEFFDIFQGTGDWSEADLNLIPVLFCVFAAEKRLRPVIDSVPKAGAVKPNRRPIQRVMLSAIIEANDKYGADLVELDSSFSSTNARVIKRDLDPNKDRQKIYKYELTGMIGDPEKLRGRLLRYAETGVNWDDAKSFLFKGIPLPPPSRAP